MSAGLTVAANFSTHFANQAMLRVRKTANSMLGLADAGSATCVVSASWRKGRLRIPIRQRSDSVALKC
jgi:hypothetical protein